MKKDKTKKPNKKKKERRKEHFEHYNIFQWINLKLIYYDQSTRASASWFQ